MFQLTLNGEIIQTDKKILLDLLNDLQLSKGRFAVEINGSLVPKSKLAEYPLENNLTIEVVQAVGGG